VLAHYKRGIAAERLECVIDSDDRRLWLELRVARHAPSFNECARATARQCLGDKVVAIAPVGFERHEQLARMRPSRVKTVAVEDNGVMVVLSSSQQHPCCGGE